MPEATHRRDCPRCMAAASALQGGDDHPVASCVGRDNSLGLIRTLLQPVSLQAPQNGIKALLQVEAKRTLQCGNDRLRVRE